MLSDDSFSRRDSILRSFAFSPSSIFVTEFPSSARQLRRSPALSPLPSEGYRRWMTREAFSGGSRAAFPGQSACRNGSLQHDSNFPRVPPDFLHSFSASIPSFRFLICDIIPFSFCHWVTRVDFFFIKVRKFFFNLCKPLRSKSHLFPFLPPCVDRELA